MATPEEKNDISHRGRAVRELLRFLRQPTVNQ
jgi:inosine/xanthosine triphosphate pyrophosphatase family protein